jgi:aryl-alcohol dehydrogenase-like predicted oxidoreductase
MLAKRPFGKTGLQVSPITFGAWSIGGPATLGGVQVGWSGVNDNDSLDALAAAFDAGINTYDTADAYANGHSESLLGQAFKSKRDNVILSSKVGLVDAALSGGAGLKLDFSPQHITEGCEASLKRLQTDYLDIYLLHLVLDNHPLREETKKALESLKAAGKIRHFGVSVQFPHQAAEQLDKNFGDSMMIEYSPLKRKTVPEILDRAKTQGVGVITRGALEKGLLSAKYHPGHRFPKDDVRSRIPADYIDRTLKNVQTLNAQAKKEGWSLLGMSLAFQLAQPGCGTISLGLKTRQQVAENVAALNEKHTYNWPQITAALQAI